jgi:hypothetical protein
MSGTWTLNMTDFSGHPVSLECTFKQDGTKLNGHCGDAAVKMTGTVRGRKVALQHQTGKKNEITAHYSGELNEAGTGVKGKWTVPDPESAARRKRATHFSSDARKISPSSFRRKSTGGCGGLPAGRICVTLTSFATRSSPSRPSQRAMRRTRRPSPHRTGRQRTSGGHARQSSGAAPIRTRATRLRTPLPVFRHPPTSSIERRHVAARGQWTNALLLTVGLFVVTRGFGLTPVVSVRFEEVANHSIRSVFKAGAECVPTLVEVALERLGVDDESDGEADDAEADRNNPGNGQWHITSRNFTTK